MAAISTRTFRPSAGQRRLAAKLLGALLSLAFVLVFNFFLFRVLPGDPAKNLTRNRLVPAEQVQVLQESFGWASRCTSSSPSTSRTPSAATSASPTSSAGRCRR